MYSECLLKQEEGGLAQEAASDIRASGLAPTFFWNLVPAIRKCCLVSHSGSEEV